MVMLVENMFPDVCYFVFFSLKTIVVQEKGQVLYNTLISQLPLFMSEWLFSFYSSLKSQPLIKVKESLYLT